MGLPATALGWTGARRDRVATPRGPGDGLYGVRFEFRILALGPTARFAYTAEPNCNPLAIVGGDGSPLGDTHPEFIQVQRRLGIE